VPCEDNRYSKCKVSYTRENSRKVNEQFSLYAVKFQPIAADMTADGGGKMAE